MSSLTAHIQKQINAPVEKVWKALTDPEMISQYLFGTHVYTDWIQGSPITYKGTWQGKPYEDKGRIIEIVPNKKLHTTYLSGLSGKEDVPENYNHVIYELDQKDGHTLVSLSQDHISDEKELEHMNQNWNMVLEGMRKVVEGS